MASWVLVLASIIYAAVLFAVAYVGDRWAGTRRRLTNNPTVYALSLAVYCTTWTFYGSVGRAAVTGVGFLPIYLGPTLTAVLWLFVLRKMIRISKVNRITSIADFVGSRYGKHGGLSGLVTIIAVVGIIPYLALQLKAITTSFSVLAQPLPVATTIPLFSDTALLVALLMAAFIILFGTRHLDATEHDAGLVLSIAFESIVKLVAFMAVGLFVTYGLYDGFGDLFGQATAVSQLRPLFTLSQAGSFGDCVWLMGLSMLAIMFLPRQFQMAVLENVDERHLFKASWLFPLYLLLINIFVLPIAMAGDRLLPNADADFFVLTLPLSVGQNGLALLAYVGGLSAATGMLIVSTFALSTMVSNDLVVPLLLRWPALRLNQRTDLTGVLLVVRRLSILVILLLAYGYFHVAGDSSLVSIGLISFAAVAQFAPAILGGIYWKQGNLPGAMTGLIVGFLFWFYTLPLPSLVELGGLPASFVNDGPFGIGWLRPYALFGVADLTPLTHSLMWSLLLNAGCYVIGSLLTEQTILEHTQATRFVDVFERSEEIDRLQMWGSTIPFGTLRTLVVRFLGERRTRDFLHSWPVDWHDDHALNQPAPPELVNQVEKMLAGAVGAASAHVIIASVTEPTLTFSEVMNMLDETSQVLRYSRELERQSQELESKTVALHEANERLKELDKMKSEFVSHVTHELRTPLTSIRAFSEILLDNPSLGWEQRAQFLKIIMDESQRLTRLINNVLDLSKIESGNADWLLSDVDMGEVVQESVAAVGQLFRERAIQPELTLPPAVPIVRADRDRLVQVMLNLLSNAIKFSHPTAGRVWVCLDAVDGMVRVSVRDNGEGIHQDDMEAVFDRFRQVRRKHDGNPTGTGLGLPISRHIVEHFGGQLWAESEPGNGATFYFTLPLPVEEAGRPQLLLIDT